jgi:hypothetical protein
VPSLFADKSVLGEGSTAVMDIRIWADKANRQLFIRDRGIGMSQVCGSNPMSFRIVFCLCYSVVHR